MGGREAAPNQTPQPSEQAASVDQHATNSTQPTVLAAGFPATADLQHNPEPQLIPSQQQPPITFQPQSLSQNKMH